MRAKVSYVLVLTALLIRFVIPHLSAQVVPVPSLMNFQGRLTRPDGTPVADGTYSLRVSLWDAVSGGTEKWNQTLNTVTVRNGVFSILLNNINENNVSADRWLEIKVGNNAPLSPRQQLASVAYALKANTVPDGSITSAKLSNNLLSTGGDLTGTLPDPLLATKASSLAKVSGGVMTSNGVNIGINNPFPGFSLDVYRPSDGNIASFLTPDTFGTTVAIRNNSSGGTNFSLISTGSNHPLGPSNLVIRDVGRGLDRLVIDTEGKIGIGSSLPDAKLDVNGGIITDTLSLNDNRSEGAVQLNAYSYSTTDSIDVNTIASTNATYSHTASGWQSFTSSVNATFTAIEVMVHSSSGKRTTINVSSTLRIYAGEGIAGTLLKTIPVSVSVPTGDGNKLVRVSLKGGASLPDGIPLTAGQKYTFQLDAFPNSLVEVSINYFATNPYAGGRASTAATQDFLFRTYYGSGDLRYGLDVNGPVRSNGSTLTSDARFKTHVETFENALDTILNLRGVAYDWDRTRWPERGFPQGKQIGFIAQEVEQVLPELVSTDSKGYKSVAYANIVPVLVEAVKAQQKQRQADRAEIAELKAKNAELEARLERIEAALHNQK